MSDNSSQSTLFIYLAGAVFDLNRDERTQFLQTVLATYGTVVNVSTPSDKETRELRPFSFVEMGSKSEAEAVIEGLVGTTHMFTDADGGEHEILFEAVNIAKPRPEGGSGGGFNNNRGGGNGDFRRPNKPRSYNNNNDDSYSNRGSNNNW